MDGFILDHQEWIEGVIRGITHDEHLAGDVAQEVWLTALSKKATRPNNIKAWYRGIVRYVVFQLRRSERRRQRRERSAARPEAVADPTSALESAQVNGLVAQRIAALPEPYRSTVILRYFEGLKPRDIARRQGVPVNTVRTRHQRALVLLRRSLDGEKPTGRQGWLPALAALLAGRTRAAALAASAVAVTLSAVVVPLVLLASEGDPPLPHTVRTSSTSIANAPPGALATAGPPRAPSLPSTGSKTADASRPATPTAAEAPGVRGIVRDGQGRPLRGARVQAYRPFGPRDSGGRVVELPVHDTTETGPDGRFGLRAQPGWFIVEASYPGLAGAKQLAHRGRRLAFRLEPPGEVVGQVRRALTGEPVPHAMVILHGRGASLRFVGFLDNGAPHLTRMEYGHARQRTGADGRFRFGSLAPGRYRLSLFAPGNPFVKLDRSTILVEAGRVATRDLVIPPVDVRCLRGRVVAAATKNPIPEALVHLDTNPAQVARTDEAGKFAIYGIVREQVLVRVAAMGFLGESVEVDCRGGNSILRDFALSRPVRAAGRIVNAQGEAIAGAFVAASAADVHHPRERVVTDDSGRFDFPRLRPGKARLYAVADGYTGRASAPFEVRPGGAVSGLIIRLKRGGTVEGRLFFDGPPPMHTAVCLQALAPGPTPEGGFVVGFLASTSVERDGVFRFRDVPPGRYRITAWLDSHYRRFPDVFPVIAGETTRAIVRVADVRRCKGTVVDEGGRPVPHARVRLQSEDPAHVESHAYTDSQGRFLFFGAPARPFRLTADIEDADLVPATIDAHANQAGVRIALERRHPLTGRVVFAADGAPARFFWVRVHPHSPFDGGSRAKRYFSSADGRFRLEHQSDVWGQPRLPRGTFDIEAGTDRGHVSRLVCDVSGGMPTAVTLCLEAGGNIRGVVLGPDGRPAQFARVEVVEEAGHRSVAPRLTLETTRKGRFALHSLRPGRYRIHARHEGRESPPIVVSVHREETAKVRIRLRIGLSTGRDPARPDTTGAPARPSRAEGRE